MRRNFLAVVAVAASSLLASADPPPVSPPEPGIPRYGPPGLGQPASQQFKELIPSLIEALKDTDADVRQHSAMALAALGQEAIAPLTEAIQDANKQKRASAAYALGQMGFDARGALPALLKALKDEEAVVRRSSSQAISRILNSESVAFGRGVGFPGMSPRRPIGGLATPLTVPSVPAELPKSIKPELPK